MNDYELLIRLRNEELSADDKLRLERRLREEPELAARYDRLSSTADAVESLVPSSFGPFFATRLMARIRAEEGGAADTLYDSLRWMFARVAVPCLVVAVVLGVYSAIGGGYGGTVIEAMLGLPEATLETALALGG